jgi:ribosomal protein L11 methyltransferase
MPDALFLLSLEVRAKDAEALGGVLMGLGAGAVEERPAGRRRTLAVYGSSRAELSRLVARSRGALAGFSVDPRSVRIERCALDWQAAALAHTKPIRLTPRLRLDPGASADAATRSDGVIAIRPGLAFGDGSHPTTRLAARAVEAYCRTARTARVLDVGTGNGVLAFVAAKSGARAVTGVEIDPQVLAIARKNARLNRFTCPVSLRASVPRESSGFDLVVANLEPRVLVAAAASLAAAASRASRLLLTGVLTSQEGVVREPFERAGFAVRGRAHERGWLLLALAPRSRPRATR